jgi:hypothetical protein
MYRTGPTAATHYEVKETPFYHSQHLDQMRVRKVLDAQRNVTQERQLLGTFGESKSAIVEVTGAPKMFGQDLNGRYVRANKLKIIQIILFHAYAYDGKNLIGRHVRFVCWPG